jgi:hypothetical protein
LQIVAFGGLAKAGKTTAVNTIAKWCVENGFTPQRLSFAGPLKKAAAAIGAIKGSDHDDLYRAFCQMVGKKMRDPEWVPGITGPDYWVRLMIRSVRQAMNDEGAHLHDIAARQLRGETESAFHETAILIDDVRFENEVETVKTLGGKMVFVDAAQRLDDLDAPWRQHPSEHLARDYTAGILADELFDWSISNTQTEDAFIRKVEHMTPAWLGTEANEARR